jgi:XTP/dITP diphosphohydrolase
MKLLIATRNPGKFSEIKAMFDALSARGVELLSLQDLAIFEDCVEDGATFQENSFKKARFYSELSGLPTVADDSGLLVNALRGELGVQTRRWGAGENATDEEWLRFFMNRMESEVDRSAHFVSVASYFDGHSAQSFVGETRGSIAEHVLAPIKHGIPLSSVFIPEGMDQAYSQLSFEEKARISHRGKAFSQLLAFLEEIL